MAALDTPLTLPSGVTLKNRIAKSAMSDSLGDGKGNPTASQIRLYERWAAGGVAVSIIGEVQGRPENLEAPGNLVLDDRSDHRLFQSMARRASVEGHLLWLQLGHAGALAYERLGKRRGPSALNLTGLTCEKLSREEIEAFPDEMARTAALAKTLGFGGVEIHAAHGFLLSQFLSPLFNRRTDHHGGSIENRARLICDTIERVRGAVGDSFPIALKINSSDGLEGGLTEDQALAAIAILDKTALDVFDISGGTYFPGAKSSSDSSGSGPYFFDFAAAARKYTDKPLMVTGGFRRHSQAQDALASGVVDIVGLARAMVIDPDLPNNWLSGDGIEPTLPRFKDNLPGGVTAWYTMRIASIADGSEADFEMSLPEALRAYEGRDEARSRE
jgi:2,4-dienoyl-CoA reductase-like NADH-dependent reductase (Old Yellow Enzyme family)